MAINETIVTGRYFRRCTDAANKVWQRISIWHKASDCEFDDGTNAQTKVGAIKGITTSTSVTQTGYAADMTTVKNLQAQINELNSNIINSRCIKIGGAGTYNLSSLSGYQKFTNANFFLISNNASASAGTSDGYTEEETFTNIKVITTFTQPSLNYNQNTGILTVRNGAITGTGQLINIAGHWSSWVQTASQEVTCMCYLYMGNIGTFQ